MLEKAVTWIIITIVVVFDPLAVIMLLASQMTFGWKREESEETDEQAHKRIESELAETIQDLGIADKPPLPETEIHFEGVRMPNGEWVQTGPSFEVPVETPKYEADDGPLTADQIQQINELSQGYADKAREEELLEETKQDIEIVHEPEVEIMPVVDHVPEATPGRNRGIMNTHLAIEADNTDNLGKASNSDFGNVFPANPDKGDVYLRTDFLPNRLFKYNGIKWIEVDKNSTDVYAYEEEYIKHLISEIDAGRYDPETLTDVERNQIAEYLKNNAQ
jgi:chorismate mutase